MAHELGAEGTKESLLDTAAIEHNPDDRIISIELPGWMQEHEPGADTVPLKVRIRIPEQLERDSDQPIDIVFAIHGQAADGLFDDDVAERLQAEGYVVVAPSTSRRSEYNPSVQPDFEAWSAESFADKGWRDEVGDFKKAIDVARAVLRRELGKRRARFHMLGDSLGAGMAADLAGGMPVESAVMIAPSLNAVDRPEATLVGQDRPTKDELLSNLADVHVTAVRGSLDPIVDQEQANAYGLRSGGVTIVEGTGHTFGKIPFIPGDEQNKRPEMIEAVVSALRTAGTENE